MRDEKIFFTAGDVVQLKQDIINKPELMVQSIDKTTLDKKPALLGVTCIWFTSTGELQKHRFSTKDLEYLNK
jgi:uncharacterized protein YodC (DUF2158 family)